MSDTIETLQAKLEEMRQTMKEHEETRNAMENQLLVERAARDAIQDPWVKLAALMKGEPPVQKPRNFDGTKFNEWWASIKLYIESSPSRYENDVA
jgi:hypothetical protein